MDLTYIIIAAVIIALPFILTRLFSGGGKKDATTVLGASTPRSRDARAAAESALLSDEVKALLARGDKIAAVKLLRDHTGLGLKEAKDVIDKLG